MTATLLPIVYPLDTTGVNPNNKITNEPHVLGVRKRRAIAPNYGIFYKEGVVIKDTGNANRILEPTEYSFAFLQSIPTEKIGKEIYAIIIIENPLVSSNVTIDVQMVGGEYSRNYTPIKEMIDILLNDNRPITYPNIIDKPSVFAPVLHFHAMGDSVGYEYVLAAVTRLRDTILIKDSLNIENLLKYIEARSKGSNDKINKNALDILELFQTSSSLNNEYISIQNLFLQISENLADSSLRAAEKIANYQNQTTP